MTKRQEVQTQLDEFDASYGVKASVPDPQTKTVTPPGGDASGEKSPVVTSPTAVKVPGTKAGLLNAIVSKVSSMDKDGLKKAYSSLVAGVPAGEQAQLKQGSSVISQPPKVTREDVAELSGDVDALFDGEQFDDDFRSRARDMFETALVTAVNKKLCEVTSSIEESAGVAGQEITEELVDQIDKYLNYVTEKWLEDNQVAIESSIRAELAESFMAQLRQVFVEHYIDVPDDKIDVVDELGARNDELEDALNAELESNVDLRSKLDELHRVAALDEARREYSLSDVQASKLAGLVENIDYDDPDQLRDKIDDLVENFVVKTAINENKPSLKTTQLDEQLDEQDDGDKKPSVTDPTVARYAEYISKSIRSA